MSFLLSPFIFVLNLLNTVGERKPIEAAIKCWLFYFQICQGEEGGHYGAIAPTQPDAVQNHIGMTALLVWSKVQYTVKLDTKLVFFKRTFEGVF